MNKLLTGMLLAALLFVVAGCYKDKGNYDYLVPEEPVVTQARHGLCRFCR
jgi:hypothetical protein